MLFGFIDRVTGSSQLRQGLDASAARTRGIADRVAKASLGNADGFSLPTVGPDGKPVQPAQAQGGVDVETEMMSLADEQLRYETTAKLLEKTYAQLRTSIRGQ